MAEKSTTQQSADLPETSAVDETAALRERLAKLETQNDEFLRHLAEYQNRHGEMQASMRRLSQEVDGKLKFAHEKLASDIIGALDNLQRAADAAKQSGDQSPLTLGVLATLAQLADVLKRHGITPVPAMGSPFDPNCHQAVSAAPAADGVASQTVIAVLQGGYMIHEKVLRPAMVVVAQ